MNPVLITDCPRSMIPVEGRKPFLRQQIELLQKWKFSHFILPRRQDVFDYFGNGSALDIEVNYASSRLGSAGMIRKASRWITSRLFVLSGSSLVDCNYANLLKKHVDEQVWASVARAGYTHVGVYLFDQCIIQWIPEKEWDIERDLLPVLYNGGVDLHFWEPKAQNELGIVANFA